MPNSTPDDFESYSNDPRTEAQKVIEALNQASEDPAFGGGHSRDQLEEAKRRAEAGETHQEINEETPEGFIPAGADRPQEGSRHGEAPPPREPQPRPSEGHSEAPGSFFEEDETGRHTIGDFNQLARLGYGQKTFELDGNNITIRTLKQREELEILSRVSGYPQTAQGKAFSVLSVALALESINGKPWMRRPLGKEDDTLQDKFEALTDLYPFVIQRIIDEYTLLRSEIEEKAAYAKKE